MQHWFRRIAPVTAVLAALLLAACGGAGQPSGGGDPAPGGGAGDDPATGPRQGGTLVISKVHDADSLDPHTSSSRWCRGKSTT